ncbi:MAG: hypothetical protein P1V36_08030 [Planctomycetota bacterium]|nr:hypothetical protein [Planctomycetota bacterium]
MFRTRLTFAVAALALVGFSLIPSTATAADDDNDCHRLDMEVRCHVTPSKIVLVGDPFEVTATVRNTGDLALSNVTLALRGHEGVTQVGSDALAVKIERLEPGEERSLTRKFVSDDPGERRVSASAREERGWAAAGCYCGVLIKGLPAIQLEMIDVDIDRKAKGIFEVGESFIYILTVENDVGTALTPDLKVVWKLPECLKFASGTGDRGATISGSGQSAESSSFVLRPNQKQNFELTVTVVSVPPRNLTQARASVMTSQQGIELATETESTTLKARAK